MFCSVFSKNRIKVSLIRFFDNVTVYECENCDGCQYKPKYKKAKGNKKLITYKGYKLRLLFCNSIYLLF